MLIVLRTIVWISVASQVLALEIKPFTSEDDFLTFYQNWLSVQSPREGFKYQAALVEILMNTTVDPCEDFYQFACGNYETAFSAIKMVGPSVRRYASNALFEIGDKIMTSEIESSDSDAVRKMKQFYQHCKDNSTWDIADWGNFLKDLASWPWLDLHWSKAMFDWTSVVAKAMTYNMNSFFKLGFSEANDSVVVSLTPARLYRIDPDEIQLAAKKLSLDLQIFGQDLRNVHNFYRKIQRVRDDNNQESDASHGYSLAELRKLTPNLDFKKLLEVLYERERVSTRSLIELKVPLFFKNLSKLIGQTDKRVVANFIFVQLLLLLSSSTIDFKECPMIVREEFRRVLFDEVQRRYTDNNGFDQITQIYDRVKEQAVKEFSGWSTDMELINNLAAAQIVAPDVEGRVRTIAEMYADLTIDPNSFFNSCLAVHKNYHSFSDRFNRKRVSFYKTLDWWTKPDIGFDIFRGIRLLPPTFFKFSKHFANYAGFGLRLANEMVDVLITRNSHNVPENDLISSIKCYIGRYEKGKSAEDVRFLVRQIFERVQSLSITFQAYKKWVDGCLTTNDVIQPKGIAFNEYQNFFLAVLQNDCGDKDLTKGLMRDFYNSKEFKEAFKCPVGSKMSPLIDC